MKTKEEMKIRRDMNEALASRGLKIHGIISNAVLMLPINSIDDIELLLNSKDIPNFEITNGFVSKSMDCSTQFFCDKKLDNTKEILPIKIGFIDVGDEAVCSSCGKEVNVIEVSLTAIFFGRYVHIRFPVVINNIEEAREAFREVKGFSYNRFRDSGSQLEADVYWFSTDTRIDDVLNALFGQVSD